MKKNTFDCGECIIKREPYSTKYTVEKKTKKNVCIREPYTHNFKTF